MPQTSSVNALCLILTSVHSVRSLSILNKWRADHHGDERPNYLQWYRDGQREICETLVIQLKEMLESVDNDDGKGDGDDC